MYKNLIRRKRRRYQFEEMKKIENLRHKKPKDFWRLFKKSKSSTGNNITVEDFCSYFKNLAQEINIVNNDEAENFDNNHSFDLRDPMYEELDNPVTTDEVRKCPQALKSGKACGIDNLLNKYFIEAVIYC